MNGLPHLDPLQAPSTRQPKYVGAITIGIFMVAFCYRMGVLLAFPNVNLIQPMEMERVARSYATTGELANPYVLPTGPTAHVPPLYAILLGTAYRIWGTGESGQTAQHVLGWLFSGLRCALIFPLALYLGFDQITAAVAATLGTFYIAAFATELRGGWEAPLAAVLLIGLVYLFVRLARRRTLSAGEALAYGLFTGLSFLTSSALIPVVTGFVVVNAVLLRSHLRKYCIWLVIFAFTTLAVMAPWGIRNQRQLGRFILTRSNFGGSVWLGYHEGAAVSADELKYGDPNTSPVTAERVRRLGEVAFNNEMFSEALAWIRSHRAQAATMAAQHVVYFWFPPGRPMWLRVSRAMLTLLAWTGWFLMWRSGHPALIPITTIWVTFPPLYIIIYWSSRHRYPMESTLLLCAGFAMATCAGAFIKALRSRR